MENEAKGLMRYVYNIIRQTLSPIFFSTSNCGCHKNIISLDDRRKFSILNTCGVFYTALSTNDIHPNFVKSINIIAEKQLVLTYFFFNVNVVCTSHVNAHKRFCRGDIFHPRKEIIPNNVIYNKNLGQNGDIAFSSNICRRRRAHRCFHLHYRTSGSVRFAEMYLMRGLRGQQNYTYTHTDVRRHTLYP